MELKELVPPLELCKLIPQGEFEDSFAVRIQYTMEVDDVVLGKWTTRENISTTQVLSRNQALTVIEDLPDYEGYKLIPAPTLPEIMKELKRDYSKVGVSIRYDWCCYVVDDLGNDMTESDNSDAAAAALKLWLKLKGVEYEKE